MPRSTRSHAIRPGTLLLCAVSYVSLLPAQSTTDTLYHLHGTVRDGVTNKPIGRALVASSDRRLATMTDSEGHFNIDVSVPAKAAESTATRTGGFVAGSLGSGNMARLSGGNALMAQRPGYLTPDQPTFFPLDDSLNATDIALRLMPSAAVSGRVSAVGADSPRGVRVTLLRHQVIEGAYTWVPNGSHTTGSNGEFRFTNLQPGEYTVMTAEWAGGEPVALQRTAITRQYPPEFLGNATTVAAAARLHLHYGSDERAELQLHAATYYPIAIPVQNQPQTSPISVRLAGADTFNGFQLGWNARDGAVEGALPSGEYTLLLTGFGPQQGSAQVQLTVTNQPLKHAPVTLAAGTRIPIRVRMEFTQSSTSAPTAANSANPVQVYLRSVDSEGGFAGNSVRHGEGSNEALENVQPGTYFVHATASRGYIGSLTSGGVDLLRHTIRIGDGGSADPIDVTLRDDGGTLEGTLKTENGAALSTFASLLLVPTDGSALVQQSYAMGSSRFRLQNVPPGSYRLFAAAVGNNLRQIPYREPEAMRAYAGKGTAVTVAAGQTATVDATMIDMAELEP